MQGGPNTNPQSGQQPEQTNVQNNPGNNTPAPVPGQGGVGTGGGAPGNPPNQNPQNQPDERSVKTFRDLKDEQDRWIQRFEVFHKSLFAAIKDPAKDAILARKFDQMLYDFNERMISYDEIAESRIDPKEVREARNAFRERTILELTAMIKAYREVCSEIEDEDRDLSDNLNLQLNDLQRERQKMLQDVYNLQDARIGNKPVKSGEEFVSRSQTEADAARKKLAKGGFSRSLNEKSNGNEVSSEPNEDRKVYWKKTESTTFGFILQSLGIKSDSYVITHDPSTGMTKGLSKNGSYSDQEIDALIQAHIAERARKGVPPLTSLNITAGDPRLAARTAERAARMGIKVGNVTADHDNYRKAVGEEDVEPELGDPSSFKKYIDERTKKWEEVYEAKAKTLSETTDLYKEVTQMRYSPGAGG